MPPFAGHPGIPDPGLTTGDWLTLLLTAAIAWAAIQQVFVNRRIFALQRSIEDERKRIHIVLEFVKGDDGYPFLKVMNASARGVYIAAFKFNLVFLPESPEETWVDEDGMLLGPYGYEKMDYRESWRSNVLPLADKLPPAKQAVRLEIVAFYEEDGLWEESREFDFDVVIGTDCRISEIKSPY